MTGNVHSRSLGRARWYEDLSAALRDAERLLLLLETDGCFPAETIRIRLRVAAIRSELERLNRMTGSESRIIGIPWPDPATARQVP